jgi:putative FmdB family regulatory protein
VPNYEYQCKKCGHVFEREHAIGEKKSFRCPECSSSQTQKIISPVGVIFKGSGFYATDHRNGNGGGSKATTSTTKTASKSEDKKCDSADSCPASEN